MPPKGKGGNPRAFNDEAIVVKARDILKSSGGHNKAAAVRDAMCLYPKLVTGRGTDESIARRIERKI